jgi:hypothetical protein
MNGQKQSVEPRRLVILADGGALADLNDRLGFEGAQKKDFARIPDAVIKAFQEQHVQVACPVDSRILCTIGSEKAQSFLTKMEEVWTVRAFPLSFAKYDRAPEAGGERHKFRLRFHAYLGYALGMVTGAKAAGEKGPIIAVVTDDPHLLPCMSDSRAAGIDARLAWWQSSVGEEVSYFAARNGVPILWLSHESDAPMQPGQKRDAALEGLLKGGLTRR